MVFACFLFFTMFVDGAVIHATRTFLMSIPTKGAEGEGDTVKIGTMRIDRLPAYYTVSYVFSSCIFSQGKKQCPLLFFNKKKTQA